MEAEASQAPQTSSTSSTPPTPSEAPSQRPAVTDETPASGKLVVSDRLKQYKWPEENLIASPEEGGGFYPVRIGETFQEARLVVTKKLGWGKFSTTWLARDRKENRFVALKILSAHATQELSQGHMEEDEILRRIKRGDPQHRGYARVLHLFEDFAFESFIGRHKCLVVDALSISVADLVKAMPNPKLTIFFAAQITRDVLEGLEYLHDKCKIVHCDASKDLRPTNILVRPKFLDNIVMHELAINPTRMYLFPKTLSPNELPFHPLTSDPLLPTWSSGKAGLPQEMNWVITDFSHSVNEGFPRNRFVDIVQPRHLRAPEIVVGLPRTPAMDIWSLGCMMFEFSAAYPLFDLKDVKEEDLKLVHISQMIIRTGERPSLDVMEALSPGPQPIPDLNRQLVAAGPLGHLMVRFGEVTYGANPAEVAAFSRLMQGFLRLDPTARTRASEALKDPFFHIYGPRPGPGPSLKRGRQAMAN